MLEKVCGKLSRALSGELSGDKIMCTGNPQGTIVLPIIFFQ